MKLNVYIAKSGYCSRRKADTLIKEGSVKVGKQVILEPWYNVKSGDSVNVGGRVLAVENNVYIVFNKPYGVTSTVEDKFASRKIVDMVPKDMGRLYPVGRLDRMSRGLIIITNDGVLCQKLTHPKFEVEKEYVVTVRAAMPENFPAKLVNGVDEGGDFLSVKSAEVVSKNEKKTVISVIGCEGKNRHIRRLFSKLGASVLDLQRVRIGGLVLSHLKEGAFKMLKREEIYAKTLGVEKGA